MRNTDVTTTITLDPRRAKKDGTFPVKLRVTYLRKQKYYALKYSMTENDFKKTMSPKPRGRLKEMKLILNTIEQKAIETIDSLPSFSFKGFEDVFLNKKAKLGTDVFAAYDSYI